MAISLLAIRLNAQQDSVKTDADTLLVRNDTLKISDKNHRKAGRLFLGGDLYSPVLSSFSDRKGGLGFVSVKVYKKWNAVAEFGFEKNNFNDLDWLVDVDGFYFKVGFNWFASQDHQDASNGFYAGARFGYSSYSQTVNRYPIRKSDNQVAEYGSLPESEVSAYWIEIAGGARVRLISNLYADVSVRPQIYMGAKKQEGLDPLVIPGYGKDRGPMNFGVVWGLSWKIF